MLHIKDSVEELNSNCTHWLRKSWLSILTKDRDAFYLYVQPIVGTMEGLEALKKHRPRTPPNDRINDFISDRKRLMISNINHPCQDETHTQHAEIVSKVGKINNRP